MGLRRCRTLITNLPVDKIGLERKLWGTHNPALDKT
jgi:hypothetical protein